MSSTVLSYADAAEDWERHGLPIGNGRLGAMVLGAPGRVRLVFNVDSLWTGDENPSGEFDDAGFGAYQAFGTLDLKFHLDGATGEFERRLDLARGLYQQSHALPEVGRVFVEAFASHPGEVLALRLLIEGNSQLFGRIALAGAHEERTGVRSGALDFEGALDNGLRYRAAVRVAAPGAEFWPEQGGLGFGPLRELTLYLAAATDYAMDRETGWRDAARLELVDAALERAERTTFDAQKLEHERDHGELFNRVTLRLSEVGDLVSRTPDDARVAQYRPGKDPELLAKLFHYGRYLLIASSRTNGLPANLQGLWNDSNQPPWHSDYHTNINVQMNYWLAEPAHLAECHVPLFDLLDKTLPVCEEATRAEFGEQVPGFCYRTSLNVFGGQGWEWNATANAWCAIHYWDHYAFSGDDVFLRERAWPYFEGASRFWLARLEALDDGRLVVPKGWSPEHGPREDGVTYDQLLVWELFRITERAANLLGISGGLVEEVQNALGRLVGPSVGRWGQLMEWMEDRDDPEDRHRHTSHLIGVYPGTRIDPLETPELAEAARVALAARGQTGDSRRSWTWPWRAALWARLGSSKGHAMLDGLVAHNLLPNLVTTHPPLQLDGNFGVTAAICEMLLQSHTGELRCLPGVDFEVWPSGSFSGLKARGSFEVGARWGQGAVTVDVVSKRGGVVVVKAPYPCRAATDVERGISIATHGGEEGAARVETREAGRYQLQFG